MASLRRDRWLAEAGRREITRGARVCQQPLQPRDATHAVQVNIASCLIIASSSRRGTLRGRGTGTGTYSADRHGQSRTTFQGHETFNRHVMT